MPSHIFLGQRKGLPATAFTLSLGCSFCSAAGVAGWVGGRWWHPCSLSAGSGTAGRRWYLCGVRAGQVLESPAREMEEQTESTCSPQRRAGHCLAVGSAPSHTFRSRLWSPKWIPSPPQVKWNLGQNWRYFFQVKRSTTFHMLLCQEE